MGLPPVMVGNEFSLVPRRQLAATRPVGALPKLAVPIAPVALASPAQFIPISLAATANEASRPSLPRRLLEIAHRRSLIVFALLFLLVGSAGITVGGSYYSARVLASVKPAATIKLAAHTIAGLNLTVPASQLQSKLQQITSQPADLTVGSQTVAISPDTIKSWLQITASADKSQDYLRLNTAAMTSSLQNLANQFVKAPVNQVTSTATGTPTVIIAGTNGLALSNPDGLKQQVASVAKSVMNGSGLSFNTPTEVQAFTAVTPANFNKLLEVNVNTHLMYAYQNGQLVNTFLVTAGAPDTPTPIGEFQIWEKLPLQTMTGFNPNGTKYVQPNVPWINYFDHSGDAVHGNYWRPASVFGNINTSHGCVGVQVSEAEWIYNWAPIGTTVITHT